MRDPSFVAAHRGGLLSKKDHQALMGWAIACAQHLLVYWQGPLDQRLSQAFQIAQDWQAGRVPVGAAMKASVAVHGLARELSDPCQIAIARAIGQMVATAHMADHALGASVYALKALQAMGLELETESQWQRKQLQQLPPELAALVLRHLTIKEKGLKVGA